MVPEVNSSALIVEAYVASEQSLFELTNRSRVAFLQWQATQPDDDATDADTPGDCSFSAVITISGAKQCVQLLLRCIKCTYWPMASITVFA